MTLRSWRLLPFFSPLLMAGTFATAAHSTDGASDTLNAQSASAVVHLYNASNEDCPLLVEGDGRSAINRSCDYTPNRVMVQSMPSQATLLLTSNDCSTSTEGSGWWIKLQATARQTSSEVLPLANILDIGSQWSADPTRNAFVAPNLKIIGAHIKRSTSPSVNCALLQLPATQPSAIVYTQPRTWVASQKDQHATCNDGVLIATYSRRAGEFGYQCADLFDAFKKPFKAYDVTTVHMKTSDTDKHCPAGKVVTGLYLENSYGGEFFNGATLTCASFRNEAQTIELTTKGAAMRNRWIDYKQHNHTCERPTHPGPTYLLSPPNGFMTGLDLISKEEQWWCSEVSPRSAQ